nr:T9SS type A sorting domain-containing protein [Bacteroidota bacterium]
MRWSWSRCKGAKFCALTLKLHNVDIDVNEWANGLYVVHLQTEKEVLSKKFIKE